MPDPGIQPLPPINCSIAVTNFQAATTAAKLVNFTPLRECEIIVISEPGDTARRSAEVTGFIARRYVELVALRAHPEHTPYTEHRGGVVVLGRRNAGWEFASVPTPPRVEKMEARAMMVRRPDSSPAFIIIGMYISPLAAHDVAVKYVLDCIDHAQAAHPSVPVLVAGDLNARMQAAGDTETCARGAKLVQNLIERLYHAVAAPSRGSSCLDVVLAPAGVSLSEPTRLQMKYTDHDHAVVTTIDPSPKSKHYKWRRFRTAQFSEEVFLRTLECQLLQHAGGTPFGQEKRLMQALESAYDAAGAKWRLVPIAHTVPGVDEVISAALRNPWAAARLLRPGVTQVPDDITSEALLKAFGQDGLQKTHGNPLLPRIPTPLEQFTPVSAAEVREAIKRHNMSGCADPDGITPKDVLLASRCNLFCERLADLITKCMSTARVPPRWRDSTIVPIHKTNKPVNDVASFRPVNLTSIMGRTADRVVDARLKAQWRPHPEQYGFRKGVQINVVPYAIFGELSAAIRAGNGDRGLIVAADIQAAFPSCAAQAISKSLSAVAPELRGFKEAMLTDRRLRVCKHERDKTRYEPVVDGTSQGYVSGPTDFSATTTELLERLEAWSATKLSKHGFAMVADDLTFYAAGKIEDLRLLATEFLAILAQWAGEQGHTISPKSKALFIKPKTTNNAARNQWPSRSRGGTQQLVPLKCGNVEVEVLQDASSIRVLGFHFDGRLTLKKAVDEVCDAHNRALMHILPLMPFIDMSDRLAMYDALAVSHVRTVAPVLVASPDRKELIDQLDRVLALGARAITGISRTAHRDATIFEAGFLPVAIMGRKEAVRLVARLSDPENTTGRTARRARDFLARATSNAIGNTVGVVVDAAPVRPEDLPFAAEVQINSQPRLSRMESARLRHLVKERAREGARGDSAEIRSIKQSAVVRILDTIPPDAAMVSCDGSVWKKRGGAAAAIGRPDRWRPPVRGEENEAIPGVQLAIATLMQPAGRDVCSYTAEVRAFDCALTLIETAGDIGFESVREFHAVTDSQSMLAALELGPLRQRDPRLARAWLRMVLLAKRGIRIHLHFGFGHVDWPFGDHVDELAREASHNGGADASPPWWIDVSAFNAEIEIMAKERLQGSLRADAKQFGPTRWDKDTARRLHQSRALKMITQLRTDSCAKIGGHLVNQTHRCRRCNRITKRSGVDGSDESMVRHLFTCPWGRTHRRNLRMRGVGSLWSRPFVAIEYLRRFVGGEDYE